MSIKVKCQKCQSEVETQEVFIGQEIECPDCHQFFCVSLPVKEVTKTYIQQKKVGIIAGFTEKQRLNNYNKAKKKYEKNGWKIIDYFNGGLTKSSYMIVEPACENPKPVTFSDKLEQKIKKEKEIAEKQNLERQNKIEEIRRKREEEKEIIRKEKEIAKEQILEKTQKHKKLAEKQNLERQNKIEEIANKSTKQESSFKGMSIFLCK